MKETRHNQLLATLQGSPMANPESLKDKAWNKYLICRQAGHWAKECPNRDKSPKMTCYRCHQLGHWAALYPWDPKASRSSTKPSLTMVQCNWSSLLKPTCLSQITIKGLEPRVQVDVVGRSENFLIDTGATRSWPPVPESSSLKPVPFWALQEKQLQKDSPEDFVAGIDKYFPTSFWWSLSVLLPYWKEMFPCLRNLAAIEVLIKDALKLSLGGKLFLLATKWNNASMGEAFMDVLSEVPQISGSADGKSRPDYIPLWGF